MPSTGKGKAPPGDHPPVPEGPLEDILIRLDAVDLARASAACTSFRGAIADPAFRRRFARLHHPPPLVGFFESEGPAPLHPRAPRARSLRHAATTPAARAVAGAADFACSFLPVPDPAGSWRIRDASAGRLLLCSRSQAAADSRDLMVCDPLHRTFVRVPPVPDHLTAAGEPRPSFGWFTFLVPPDPAASSEAEKKKEEEKERPPLQVVWMMQRGDTIFGFVFSSSTQEWRPIPTFCGWTRESPLLLFSYRLYAHGCFYWTSSRFRSHTVLKLDMREMEFSTMELPSATEGLGRTNFIVEASGGDLGALVLGDHGLDLYCRRSEGNGGVGAAADWRHSRTIPLPHDNLDYSVVGAADGYLLLQAYPQLSFTQWRRQAARYFSLKIKTLVFEELHVSFNKKLMFVHLYTNFPPLLSLPSVCNEEKVKA